MCFYFDGKKDLKLYFEFSAPYLNTWLPLLEVQDKKAMLETAFNEGAVKFHFSENEEGEYNEKDVTPIQALFFDSSFLNVEYSFNDVVLNNIIEKKLTNTLI